MLLKRVAAGAVLAAGLVLLSFPAFAAAHGSGRVINVLPWQVCAGNATLGAGANVPLGSDSTFAGRCTNGEGATNVLPWQYCGLGTGPGPLVTVPLVDGTPDGHCG